jgi:hypothetical protein
MSLLVICTEGAGDAILAFPAIVGLMSTVDESSFALLLSRNNSSVFDKLPVRKVTLPLGLPPPGLEFKTVINLNTGNDQFGYISGRHLLIFDGVKTSISSATVKRFKRLRTNAGDDYMQFVEYLTEKDADRYLRAKRAASCWRQHLPIAPDVVESGSIILSICKIQYGLQIEHFRKILYAVMSLFPDRVIVLTGRTEQEVGIAQALNEPRLGVVNLAGRLRFDQFAGFVRDSKAVVTFDSLAMHLANLYSRPMVCFFRRHWNYRSYFRSDSRGITYLFDEVSELESILAHVRRKREIQVFEGRELVDAKSMK